MRFGANVQPGQILAISSEPGKEQLARAIAEVAYGRGAQFVDLPVFDVHLKRARALHADPDTLGFVPPWYGQRLLALGEQRGARIALTGPVAPQHHGRRSIPRGSGRDMLPARAGDAADRQRPHDELDRRALPDARTGRSSCTRSSTPDAALARLWEQIAHVCRLDEPDPVAAWEARLDPLAAVAASSTRCSSTRCASRVRGPT